MEGIMAKAIIITKEDIENLIEELESVRNDLDGIGFEFENASPKLEGISESIGQAVAWADEAICDAESLLEEMVE